MGGGLTRNVLTALLWLLAVLVLSPPLIAQTTASLDAGFSHLTYGTDSTVGASVVTVAPTLDLLLPNASLTATGGYARFTSGSWSLQGAAAGSWYLPASGPVRAELGGGLSGSAYPSGTGTGRLRGLLRVHWIGQGAGVWLGGSLGRASDGFGWQRLNQLEVGGWARRGPLALAATVTPTFVGSLRYTDLQLVGRLVRGPAELTASGGLRVWGAPTAPGSGWAGVTGVYWVDRHLALVGAVGGYPADYAEANPQGRYVTVGVRLATGRPPRPTAEREGAAALRPALTRPVVPSFQAVPVAGGMQLAISAPGAARVEIMGDFTDWEPVQLQPQAGRWQVTLPIAPGVHRFNLRVDGGDWGVPPGVPVLTDDFGGVVALLTVE